MRGVTDCWRWTMFSVITQLGATAQITFISPFLELYRKAGHKAAPFAPSIFLQLQAIFAHHIILSTTTELPIPRRLRHRNQLLR